MSAEANLIERTIEVINKYNLEINTIIDCGACFGQESIYFSIKFPHARILTFEPRPEVYDLIKQVEKDHNNITFYPYAVFSKNAKMKFNLYHPHSSLYVHPKFRDENYGEEIEVDCVKLCNYDTPDWLWMDIQGAELDALKGMEEKLRDVKIITVEIYIHETYVGTPLFPETHAYLEEYGFVREFGATPELGGSGFDNFCYVNKKYIPDEISTDSQTE